MESRIQLRKFRILLKIEIQNPCSTEKDWNQESTTCNLESKTVLDSLTWGEIEALVSRTIVKLLVEQSRFSTRLIYIDHRQLVSRTWITNGKMVLRLLWPRGTWGWQEHFPIRLLIPYYGTTVSMRAIEFFKCSTCLFHFSINFLAVNASTTTKNFLSLREQWRTVKQEED